MFQHISYKEKVHMIPIFLTCKKLVLQQDKKKVKKKYNNLLSHYQSTIRQEIKIIRRF